MDTSEATVNSAEPTPPRVRVGRCDLVVFAGLPGAGKSTVLHKLYASETVPVLDSEQVRGAVRSLLPRSVPYGSYRAVVHCIHRARIAWYCAAAASPVIAHEPSTRPTTRVMLLLIALLTRRQRVLVWLHVDAVEALAGQYARGRRIRAHSFVRHVRHADRVQSLLRRGCRLRGWNTVHVFTREDLDSGVELDVAQ
ncbi:hypothetical protein FHX42_000578 [Saccharopolyspora lacisalsi]|uniref:AAA domain-containing protein n=1 Tax=Halosaccharopolyspora lacisalsi TaxID=1000566 RepID=A0A839DR92_9PSEU|nr:AAA family ATPase [Halosaccharopolyspora lacisalsi]MBA8823249.1 hypothetical protein [Halosaccharopolyspora lacisalsi]